MRQRDAVLQVLRWRGQRSTGCCGAVFYGGKYEGASLVSLERLYEVGTFNWTSLDVIVSLVS